MRPSSPPSQCIRVSEFCETACTGAGLFCDPDIGKCSRACTAGGKECEGLAFATWCDLSGAQGVCRRDLCFDGNTPGCKAGSECQASLDGQERVRRCVQAACSPPCNAAAGQSCLPDARGDARCVDTRCSPACEGNFACDTAAKKCVELCEDAPCSAGAFCAASPRTSLRDCVEDCRPVCSEWPSARFCRLRACEVLLVCALQGSLALLSTPAGWQRDARQEAHLVTTAFKRNITTKSPHSSSSGRSRSTLYRCLPRRIPRQPRNCTAISCCVLGTTRAWEPA